MSDQTLLGTLLSVVEGRRMRALERMEAGLGDESLCALSRSGQPLPAVKYDEGVAATLGDLGRRLRRLDPAADEAALLEVISQALTDWRAGAAPRLGSLNADWRAYAIGGEDALEALLDATDW